VLRVLSDVYLGYKPFHVFFSELLEGFTGNPSKYDQMVDIFDYSGLADVLGKQMLNELLDVLFVLVADVAFQLQAFHSPSENLVIFVDVFPVRGH